MDIHQKWSFGYGYGCDFSSPRQACVFYNNQAKAGMKRKASETQEAMHSIMTSSINHLSEEYAVNLPKLDT